MGFEGNCDRLQHYEVRYPGHALIRAVFMLAGSGEPDGCQLRLRRCLVVVIVEEYAVDVKMQR